MLGDNIATTSSSLKREERDPAFALAGHGQPNHQVSNDDEKGQLTDNETLATITASLEPNLLRPTQSSKETPTAVHALSTSAILPSRNPSAATTTPPNRLSQRQTLVGGLLLLITVALVAVVVITVNWSNTIEAGPLFITLAPSTSPSFSPSVSVRPSPSPSNSFKTNVMELIQSRSPESNFSSSSVGAALDWIVNDPYSVDLEGSDDRVVQRFALATVWFSFGLEASSGREFEGWMKPTGECTWRGRSLTMTPMCDGANILVTGLDLDGGNGTGSIPTEIILLSHLSFLGVRTDSLTGTIPPQLSFLTSLTSLQFGSAGALLTGTIPPGLFSSLTNLERFQIGPNPEMSPSTIPSHISSLSKLTSLGLYGVPVSGSIPVELFSLSSLRFLTLGLSSGLTGSIPSTIGLLSRLSRLDVHGAELTGTIPTEVGRLDLLYILNLGYNIFTGTIPTEVGLLTQLSWLVTQSLGVQGTIPTELGQLDRLLDLKLGRNPLNGTIPTELARLTKLTHLGLERCNLEGSIPLEFVQLGNLEGLDLSSNGKLAGTLMTEIGSLLRLAYLRLGWNDFDGTIPSELGLLTGLGALSLENNRLSGSIPSELSSLTQLDGGLHLEANDLTGAVPDSLCFTSSDIRVESERVDCSCCVCCQRRANK